jgi:hypothetical protein
VTRSISIRFSANFIFISKHFLLEFINWTVSSGYAKTYIQPGIMCGRKYNFVLLWECTSWRGWHFKTLSWSCPSIGKCTRLKSLEIAIKNNNHKDMLSAKGLIIKVPTIIHSQPTVQYRRTTIRESSTENL